MKKLYKKLIGLSFLAVSMINSATGQCTENSSVSAQDDSNPVVNISSFPCTGGGAITAMTMDAAIGTGCGSAWYSYDVVVNGNPILTNQCDLTAYDLSAYLPITSVEIQGHDDDVWSDAVVLDLTLNITYIAASCPSPNTQSTVPTATSADLAWVEAGSATQWQVEWGTTTFAQGTGTLAVTSTNPHNITGLTANMSYDFYVRAICAVGDTSTWAGPFTFSTLCSAFSVPFIEGFNSASTTQGCWTVLDNDGDVNTWDLDYTTNPFEGDEVAMMYTDFLAGANDDYLISPQITLTGNERLRYSYRVQSAGEPNDFEVLLSTTSNSPASFTNVLLVDTSSNITYVERIIDLSAYTGNVFIAFHIPAGGLDGWRLYIDDVNVEAIPSCVDPTALTTTNVSVTAADLGWTENGTATSWQIEWDTLGFPQGTGTFAVASSNPHNLTGLTANTSYDFYVRAICGVGDTSNWDGPLSFNTACNTFSVPFVEGFNSASTSQSCWTVLDNDGDVNTWDLDYTANSFEGDEVAVMYTDFNAGANDDFMITPQITLTGNERLRYSYRVQSSGEPNDFEVLLSTTSNSPASFTNVLLVDTSSNITYMERIIDLSAFSGNVYIAFHIPAGGLDGWRLYIDDVNVEAIPSCVDPTMLSVTNTTASAADLGWTENGTAASWQIEWDTLGFPQGIGTLAVTSTNPHNITGLTPNTGYDYYVRSICGVGDTSNWVGPFTFSTPCTAFNVPWIEGFESITVAGEFPSCVTADGDFTTETVATTNNRAARTGTDYAYTAYSADDWFYTAGINLTAGTSYDFSTWYNTDGLSGWDTISLWVGSDQMASSMTDSLTAVVEVTNTSYQQVLGSFIPSVSGVYYFGVKVEADGIPWYISFDDLKVDITPTDDLAVIDVTTSAVTGCSLSNAETITMKIKNMGAASQSNFDVGYALNGTPISPETITATILSGDTLTYTFTTVADMSTPMIYNVDAYSLLVGDQNTGNDSMSLSVNHIIPSLAFNDSLFVSDNVTGGTHGIICTNGLLPNQLDNCYQLSAIVIDSLTHAYDGDLDIYLIAPSGDTLEISTDNGGSGVDYIDVVFTDTAATNINTVSAGGFPTGGYYAIEDTNGLGSLNGIDPNGMWDLWITDDAGGDDGMLFSWHLEFTDNSFVVDLGANSSVCAIDDSVTLDAGAGTYSYSWSTTDSTQMITVSESSVTALTISVLVTDTLSQCTSTDTVDVSFGDCSSVSELSALDFSIYPNPSNGTFTIAAGEVNNTVSIEVFDMQGRVILSIEKQINTGSKNTITLGDVEHGIYLVDIVSNVGRFTQTIVIE